MKDYKNVCITAVTAFAAGFLTAMFVTPQSGSQTRRKVAQYMNEQSQRLAQQLHSVEEHLTSLEKQIEKTSEQFSQKVAEATSKVVSHVVPTIPSDETSFEIDGAELMRDLRRMPHQ